jgi:AAHS family 4-hydroxybenzoate transporter-like MFS transporter
MTTQVLETTQQPVIDIGSLAEVGAWSTSRKQGLLLCALAIILMAWTLRFSDSPYHL